MNLKDVLEVIGNIADISGAIGGVVAAYGVISLLAAQQRAQERVEVALRLEGEGRTVVLPLELCRRDVSRAELLGRIGMLPMRSKGARFALRALSTSAFMAAVNDVVAGKATTLLIPCTGDELDQFDLN